MKDKSNYSPRWKYSLECIVESNYCYAIHFFDETHKLGETQSPKYINSYDEIHNIAYIYHNLNNHVEIHYFNGLD